MTEDEAKTKWCFAAVASHTDPRQGFQENSGAAKVFPCLGSRCMAFRWLPDATVALSGNEVRVDAADADLLEGCWWDGRYARSKAGRIHRLIAERALGVKLEPHELVDHIDGDTGNCRRGNLRVVNASENAANSAARGGASKYRGVWPTRGGRWQAQISRKGVRRHLGTFDTEEQAAAAYDAAAELVHGEFARPNLSERIHSGRQGYCGLAGKP